MHEGAVEREVGIDDFYGVARVVDGVGIELTDDLIGDTRLTVDHSHHLLVAGGGGVGLQPVEIVCGTPAAVVFRTMHVLSRHLVPDSQEDGLQCVHLSAVNAAVHVVPRTHLSRAFYIIVGHIHSTRVGYLPIDDHYLAMVAREDMIDPRKGDGVELEYLYALGADGIQMRPLQRSVVGHVAEGIKQGPHLNSLLGLLAEKDKEPTCDGVVAEIEVFKMYAALGLTYGGKHVVKLFLSRHQKGNGVVVGKAHAVPTQLADKHGVSPLRILNCSQTVVTLRPCRL